MSEYSRYEELKAAFKGLDVSCRKTHGYATATYTLTVTPVPDNAAQYTARDGAIYADHGNLCFGGREFRVSTQGNSLVFTGVIYTD